MGLLTGYGFGHRLLFNRFTMILAVATVGLVTWRIAKPPADPAAVIREALLDEAAERIALSSPSQFAEHPVAVAPLGGDPGGQVRQGLQQRLGGMVSKPITTKMLGRALEQLGLRKTVVYKLDQALLLAREAGVSAVLFGDVTDQYVTRSGGRLRLAVRWADAGSQAEIDVGPVTVEAGFSPWSPNTWAIRARRASPWPRILMWIGATLILPILASPILRRVLELESNSATFAALAAATLVDVLFCFGLLGFSVSSFGPFVFLLGAFSLSGGYNFVAISMLNEYGG